MNAPLGTLNPNAPLTEIRALARDITTQAPNLGAGAHLSPYLRGECERLANLCGLPASTASIATDQDLISVYLVARKDGLAALRVAGRVALRLDPALNNVLNAPPAPRAPEPAPAPRSAPPSAAAPDLNALRALIKEEVRDGALIPLQDTLDAFDRQLREEIRESAVDTSARVYAETLDAVRAEIETAAHAAAAHALQAMQPVRLDLYTPLAVEPRSLGLVHRKTPQLINALAAGVNVYLHGPAGSGKTTGANKCAEAFGSKFYFAAKVESEYQLLGFKDARGETVRTQFREAYEHGGVFLFDEMDASAPSAVVAMNAALANGICPFPDGTIPRHPEFRCIGAGNTKLTGANRQYAGRNQLDAASIDRFAFMEWGYDDELELALADDVVWAKYVQNVRRVVAERGLSHLVTPRATYDGCKLLAAGFDRDTAASMVVYKGLDADTVRQIEAAL